MKRTTPEEFLAKARAVHGDTYEYPDPYTLSTDPLRIRCRTHGDFVQTPSGHIVQKQGCPKCALMRIAAKRQHSVDRTIQEFRAVHGDAYDYSKVVQVTAHEKIEIICPTHGSFWQARNSHKRGIGCPLCSTKSQQAYNARRQTFLQKNFVTLATNLHNGIFDYTNTKYECNTGTITMRCTIHDRELEQNARGHLFGHNPCPQCNHMKSKEEGVIHRYCGLFTKAVLRAKPFPDSNRELDVYMPDAKVAVEYCGMYWHSSKNPEQEPTMRVKHNRKYLDCVALGVRLITLYESEWLERSYAIRRLLRNALGKGKGKLMARKCDLRRVAHADAASFYDKYHPQGGAGTGEHYGLYWGTKLVACMRFTFGANDRGAAASDRMWTLTRYATRVTVAGGASRLFKAFLAEHNPTAVKSFSDNRFFDGAMYGKLGFVLEAETGPDYQVWSQKIGLRPKSHYQRKNIPARLRDHGIVDSFDPETDPRTEAEMTYMMGAGRIYDCGKKRWLWTRSL